MDVLIVACPACVGKDDPLPGSLSLVEQDHDELNAEFCIDLVCDLCGQHWTVFAIMKEKGTSVNYAQD